MTQHTEQDDRFDRRELLLHLGDMLDAANRLAGIDRLDASVAQLAQKENALQGLEFLQTLAAEITTAGFGARVASAFCSWPAALLEAELDRRALASAVQRALFDGNPSGWKAYVTHMQKKVAWFGEGVPDSNAAAKIEPAHAVVTESAPVAVKAPAKPAKRAEKKGWPWPEPRS